MSMSIWNWRGVRKTKELDNENALPLVTSFVFTLKLGTAHHHNSPVHSQEQSSLFKKCYTAFKSTAVDYGVFLLPRLNFCFIFFPPTMKINEIFKNTIQSTVHYILLWHQGFTMPWVTLCHICSEKDTGSGGLSTLTWKITDANSSPATLWAACHLVKPLQYRPYRSWLK